MAIGKENINWVNLSTSDKTWEQLQANGGTGSDSLKVNLLGGPHTGRAERTAVFTFSANGITKDVTIKQKPADIFVTIKDKNLLLLKGDKNPINQMINITSNSSEITFSLENGASIENEEVTLEGSDTPTNLTKNDDGTYTLSVPNKLGEDAAYTVSFKTKIDTNESIDKRTSVVSIAAGSASDSISFEQDGSVEFSVNPTIIEFKANGDLALGYTESTINVNANFDLNWSVTN